MFSSQSTQSIKKQAISNDEDLTMWRFVLQAIVRIDCALSYLIDEQKLNKSVSQSNSTNLLNLETAHLVDFSKIQRKVNEVVEGERQRLNSGSGSGKSNDD
jgi:hypothetical protein